MLNIACIKQDKSPSSFTIPASVHKSHLARQHHQRWQQQGLYIFFLPPYSPQMNRIEDEWLHLKRDELASRVFEDEYELALSVCVAPP
ncbi:transposase [Brasilonema octagenarum]|uniref:Tc1-like transposase DDE domain-containing protein n=1 Tax=Brasilonema octagenarum UFV-OR1 TaxID=417115 RepID=A0ABX1M441_9CYAN|nr:hypothetical protein [Brasilonema octagenarum UFV-OR1]NMF65952.1 hypothetical protein [Brasilonema octagenarum UFV-OR1]